MKKTPLRRKRTKKQSLQRKAEIVVKQFVRQRDGRCVAQGQGNKACGGPLQGSHIKPTWRYRGMALDPKNILTMCYTHHIHWWHVDPTDAARWLKEYLPKKWYDYIEEKSKQITPVPTEDELIDIINKFERKIDRYS